MGIFAKALLTTVLSAGFAATAQAGIIFNPSTGGSSVTANLDQACLFFICSDVDVAFDLKDLDSLTNTLEVGESWEFDFFDATVSGFGAAGVEVSAELAFTNPGGSSSHSGAGGVGTFLGFISAGSLTWNGTQIVDLLDGTRFSVTLSDVLELGFGDTATVTATVQLLATATAVPEPGSLALLGAGLLGLGLIRRRLTSP